MPIPPPLIPPALFAFGGPKALIVAKTVAVEYLPAVSSASFAAILAKLAWNRVPAWIREDVSFRSSDADGDDIERLSIVLEKIDAWMEIVSEQQLHTPVPYHTATLLIYWQLLASLQKRQRESFEPSLIESTNEDKEEVFRDKTDESFDPGHLREMLGLATLAYYVNDANYLQEELEAVGYNLKTCFVPIRPGSVGYFVAEQAEEGENLEQSSEQNTRKTLLIGVRGTSSLEELLTDACGRSVSYDGPDSEVGTDDGVDSSFRIEVAAQEQDVVCTSSHFDESSGELQVEIVSGHERIWIEHAEIEDDDGDYDHAEYEIPGKHRHRRQSSMESHIRCHEGILLSAKRLFAQVRPVIEEKVVGGNYNLVLVGHSLGASAASLLAMMLRSRYPELILPDRLHVYAFAPPPVMDHDTAIGASSYVTSVVHGSDLIARSSLANLAVFLELLRTISTEILVENGWAPKGAGGTSALLRQLSKGDKAEPFWSEDKLDLAFSKAQEKVEVRDPDHLYIPGRVYFLEPRQEQTLQETGEECIIGWRHSWTLTDGTAPPLRIIKMNGYQVLGDHTTQAYDKALEDLMQA